jgi:hypothetical protein
VLSANSSYRCVFFLKGFLFGAVYVKMDTTEEQVIIETTTTVVEDVVTPSSRVSRRERTRQSTGPYSVDRSERVGFLLILSLFFFLQTPIALYQKFLRIFS